MVDPLNLLRQYNIDGKEIIEKDGQIIFGEFSWPKNVKTNYQIWRSRKDDAPKDYYTLECLLFILKNVNFSHPVYLKRAAAENIPVVRRPDRKEILDYLYGNIETCSSIDRNAPLELPLQAKRSADYDGQKSLEKKLKVEEIDKKTVIEKCVTNNKLDEPKEVSISIDNIKSLSDALSMEKIAAIKAKCLAKKRMTIKDKEDNTTGLEEIKN